MMQFEVEAYEATAAWLESNEGKRLIKSADIRKNQREQSKITAKAFRAELARVKGLKDSEDQLKAFMLGKNKIGADLQDAGLASDDSDSDGEAMLPPHKNLDELYGK
jgi:Xaa-Pro aminopeptidase